MRSQFEEELKVKIVNMMREMLSLYANSAIEMDDRGVIRQVKGRVWLKEELIKLNEDFTIEEIKEYEKKRRQIEMKLSALEKKAIMNVEEHGYVSIYYIFRALSFTDVEKFIFYLLFAEATDSQFSRIFCLLQDDFSQKSPTIESCIQIYTLNKTDHMLYFRQIRERLALLAMVLEFCDGEPIFSLQNIFHTPIQLKRRVLDFTYDVTSVDPVIENIGSFVFPNNSNQEIIVQDYVLNGIQNLYDNRKGSSAIYVNGPKGSGRKFMISHFCQNIKAPLLFIDCIKLEILYTSSTIEEVIRAIICECFLKGNAIVCLCNVDDVDISSDLLMQIFSCLTQYFDFFFMTGSEKFHMEESNGLHIMQMQIYDTTYSERLKLWKKFLPKTLQTKLDIIKLSDQFVLTPGAILDSICYFEEQQTIKNQKITNYLMSEACQKQISHNLNRDALKIRTLYEWDDLILPINQKKLLREACNQVEYHNLVYQEWGFDQKIAYGKGVSMIFYGPPGTGKTMGAQVVARELGLELYKVDMASILSKYVGESEKKLGNIFEQGKKSQSILFFDEADALFGKRSEVKDSQDKYANASTAYLLQKIEEYEGVIILATNLMQNFDNAFMRRFKFMIEFPFPDEEQRIEIWKQVIPNETPHEDLDYTYLGTQFKLSGSQIKNIVVAAVFMAAGEQRILTMKDLLRAIRRDMKKVGKNLIAADFGMYYELIEEGDV